MLLLDCYVLKEDMYVKHDQKIRLIPQNIESVAIPH